MCKSIIANWRVLDDETKTFISNHRTSSLLDDDIVDLQYTNFIVSSELNLKLESPTNAFRKDLVDTVGTSEVTYLLDTYQNGASDDRSLDFFALKFNKLNSLFMKSLRVLDVQIRFYDQYNSNPVNDITFTFSKRNPTKAVTATTYKSGEIDVNEGMLFIDKQMLEQLTGLQDRTGSLTDKLFHDSVEIKFIGPTAELSTTYAEFSNITYTNALEIELENGIKTKFKSLDKVAKSLEGKEFIDRHNTIKDTQLNIPLLSQDEFRLLDKNFFRYFNRQPFFIAPISSDSEQFENFMFAGFMKVKGSYTPERGNYNVYEVKFKIIEVI